MDLSNLSVKDLSSRIKRLEEIERVLNDSNRTKLSRRLAVEQYRGDLAEYNVVSLEEPSALKKVVGIALALLGITLMAKIWASASDGGSGNGKSSSGGSASTAKAVTTYNDVSSILSEEELKQDKQKADKYLKDQVFTDPATQSQFITEFWNSYKGGGNYYVGALLLGKVGKGLPYREVYKKPEEFKKHIAAFEKSVSALEAMVDYVVTMPGIIKGQLDTNGMSDKVKIDVANKTKAVLDTLKAGFSVIADTPHEGEADDSEVVKNMLNVVRESLVAVSDNFKPKNDASLDDIKKAADGLMKIFGTDGTSDATKTFDAFIASYEKHVLGSTNTQKSINDAVAELTKMQNDAEIAAKLKLGQSASDPSDPNKIYSFYNNTIKTVGFMAKTCARLVSIFANLDKMFVASEKSFASASRVVKHVNDLIKSEAGTKENIGKLSVARESFDPYEIASTQLYSIVPRRQISIESNGAATPQGQFDEFEFSNWIDNVSQKWIGNDVSLSWSTESLNQVAEYCRAVGIETQSSFEDTFYSRGLALEDLSKAKKFGILLAILASFGGLFALWKHFRNKDSGNSESVGSVGETVAAVETNVAKIAEGSKDLADQIRHMKFTGPEAERNLKTVKHLRQGIQKLVGTKGSEEDEIKMIVEFFDAVGKGKVNAIYLKMAENEYLGALGSRFVAAGPFGKGNTDKEVYKKFFTICNTLASYLPKLSHRAIAISEAYVKNLTKLSTTTQLDKTTLDECKQSWQAALDTNKSELDGFLKALEEAEQLCQLDPKAQELKDQHVRIREVISVIRGEFERLDSSKITDQNVIADGVKTLSECSNEMKNFVETWKEIGTKSHSSGGLDLETLEKCSKQIKGAEESIKKIGELFAEAKTNTPDLLKDQKDADLVSIMGNGTNGAVNGLLGLSNISQGVVRNIGNFCDKMDHIKSATEDLVKAMNVRSGASTESMDNRFSRLRLPPGLSLEVFEDDSYMNMTDDNYLESFELLSSDLDRLDQDTLEVEHWVERIRLRRSISQEDARYIEQFCPGLLTNKRPLATFTKFPSGTNLQISLEEGGALATGMKVAVFAALAALVVRGAMWMKKRFENSSNSLAAIKNYQEEIEKATKRTDAQSVSLRQLLEGDQIADRELDLSDGFKFRTKGGESAIHDLRDECIRKEMANRNWDKNARMESAIDPKGEIHKMFMPVQTFVLENIEVLTKSLDQVKSQVKGGSGTVSQTSATSWKGIEALQREVGGGNIIGIVACADAIKAMVDNAGGAQPNTKVDSLTYADLDKKRVELMKSFKDIDKSVINKLDKLLDKAKGLESSAAAGKGDDAQRQAAKDSAKAAQEDIKSLQSLVAAHSGATEIYKQFYEAFLAGLNRYGKLMTEIQKKATSAK